MKTNRNEKRYSAVYEVCKKMMYEHADYFNKKHGNYLVRYCPKNQVVIMDTWNGAISQGHTTAILKNGQFGPEGKVDYHTHIAPPDYMRSMELPQIEESISIYKSLLASV